jgi:hypothetical protein
MALRSLDEFAQRATKEELQAANEWIVERPEFTIYSNLSRRVQSAQSSLAPTTTDDRRKGLAWVTALARVELGGIYATFASVESPYEAVGVTDFDREAYAELLMDAAQTHVWALVNDPQLERAAGGTPDTMMLAYLRRLGVARSLLTAAGKANGSQLDRLQGQEFVEQYSKLSGLHERFAVTIAAYLRAMNLRETTTTTKQVNDTVVYACQAQLQREKQALASGKATIQTYVNGKLQ